MSATTPRTSGSPKATRALQTSGSFLDGLGKVFLRPSPKDRAHVDAHDPPVASSACASMYCWKGAGLSAFRNSFVIGFVAGNVLEGLRVLLANDEGAHGDAAIFDTILPQSVVVNTVDAHAPGVEGGWVAAPHRQTRLRPPEVFDASPPRLPLSAVPLSSVLLTANGV